MAVAGKIIILEGNISAGKSTLAKELGRALDYKVFMEPTLANPYLEDFYKAPKVYGLKMQLWLLRLRFHTYVAACKYIIATGKGVILDRSVFSDKVFADQCHIDGFISDDGYAYYMALRTQMLDSLPVPHVTLYLDVTPEECLDRIVNKRGRECESGIPIEYLRGLGECYGAFAVAMETAGSTVVCQPWEGFGEVTSVIAAIENAEDRRTRTSDSWLTVGAVGETLRAFLYDDDKLRAAMVLSYVCEGVSENDPIPEAVDVETENELEAAIDAAAAAAAAAAASPEREVESSPKRSKQRLDLGDADDEDSLDVVAIALDLGDAADVIAVN